MKRFLILSAFFLFIQFHSSAQLIAKRDSANYTIKTYLEEDTIRVSGTITNLDGRPLSGLVIFVETPRYTFDQSPKDYTDNLGQFHISYVRPDDTLHINGFGYNQLIPVCGSRIIHIRLADLYYGPLDPVQITGINKKQPSKKPIHYTTRTENISGGATEVQPTFPGGMSSFYKYLQNTVRYPVKAEEQGIKGLVKLSFYISKSGQPHDFKVIRGLGYGIEEAIIKTIEAIKWKPAISYGQPIERKIEINIQFSLSD